MVKTLQLYKIKTLCKHCKKELENVWICKLDSIVGVKYALLCADCQRLIRIFSSADFNKKAVNPGFIFDEVSNLLY